MQPPATQDTALAKLLREASRVPMDAASRARQLVSIAYGNLKLSDGTVSRREVEEAYERLAHAL